MIYNGEQKCTIKRGTYLKFGNKEKSIKTKKRKQLVFKLGMQLVLPITYIQASIQLL